MLIDFQRHVALHVRRRERESGASLDANLEDDHDTSHNDLSLLLMSENHMATASQTSIFTFIQMQPSATSTCFIAQRMRRDESRRHR
jgi:hypothetical protein